MGVEKPSRSVTKLVVVLMTETLSSVPTHTVELSGLTARLVGPTPTVIEVTALVVVLMRETVSPSSCLPALVTHTLNPSGLTATP